MSHPFILQIPWKRYTDTLLFLLLLCVSLCTTTKAFVIPSTIISPVKLEVTPSSSILNSTKNNNNPYTTTNVSTGTTLNRNRQKPTKKQHNSQPRTNHRPRHSRPTKNDTQCPKIDLATRWKICKDNVKSMTEHIFNDFSEPGSIYQNGMVKETFSLLFLWSKHVTVAPIEAPIAMDKLIKRLLQERQYQQEQSINPNKMIEINLGLFNSLLYAWTKRAIMLKDKYAAQRALEILHMLQENYEAGDGEAPDFKSFKLVFQAFCEMGELTAPRHLLGWMENLYKTKKNVNAKPSLMHYNVLLNGYANSQQANAGIMAEGLVQQMHQANIVQPTTTIYNIVIKAWSKSSKFYNEGEAAKNAERIMNGMPVHKDIITYSTVISAWASSGMKEYGALQAERLLEQIKQDPNVLPNTVVVTTVMSAWVRSESPKTVDRTMELLQYMEEESKNNANIAPNLVSYTTQLHALSSHSKDCPENAERANELLTRLEEMSDNGQVLFKNQHIYYDLVIEAWLSQAADDNDDNVLDGVESQEKNKFATRNALRVVNGFLSQNMGVQPRLSWFEKILKVVTKCTDASDEVVALANKLLSYMELSAKNGELATKEVIVGYVSILADWAQKHSVPIILERAKQIMDNIQPSLPAASINFITINESNYNKKSASTQPMLYDKGGQNYQNVPADLIEEWKTRKHRVETMTNHFCNNYSEAGALSIDGKWKEAYSLLFSWAKFALLAPKEAPIAMEQLMKQLLQERQYQQEQSINQDDTIAISLRDYNALLYAWTNRAAKLKDKEAAQRAREILHMLQETYEAGNGEAPDSKSFHLVFNAVCGVDETIVARRLLGWMEYLYRNKKNVNAIPSLFHYSSLLDKYANSQQANAGIMAEALVQQMHKSNIVQPTTVNFNIAIKAWAKSSKFYNKGEAAKNAERILNEMPVPKDIISYGTVVAAWAASRMKEYGALRAEEILEQIKQDPNVMLDSVVVNAVMSAWVQSKSPKAVDRTMELLQYMEEESLKCDHNGTIAPTMISYITHLQCLTTYSKGCPENVQQADELLSRLEEMSDNGQITFHPDRLSYNYVIKAWLSQAVDDDGDVLDDSESQEKFELAARNSLRVLRKCLSRNAGLEPFLQWFGSILTVVTKCRKSDAAAELAEELLSCMQVYCTNNCSDKAMKRVLVGYSSLIDEWAQNNDIPSVSENVKQFVNNTQPLQSTSFNSNNEVMSSEASISQGQNNQKAPADLIEQWKTRKHLVEAMTDHFCDECSEPGSLTPNEKWQQAYSLLFSWSKFAVLAPQQAPIAMERLIKRLLHEKQYQQEQSISQENTIEITLQNYNCLMHAWMTKAKKFQDKLALERTREILYMLQEMYESGNGEAPNFNSFYLVFNSACEMGELTFARRILGWMEYLYRTKKNVNAKPSEVHYSILLHRYANSQQANSGIMAEALIQHMLYTKFAQPSTIDYCVAMKAWSNAATFFDKGEAAKNAERILKAMEAPKNNVTYATVLSAWANSGMKEYAALQADKLLEQIQQDPTVTPNSVIMNIVLLAWARSGSPKAIDRIMELLHYMEEESKNDANINIAPDSASYNTCLQFLVNHSKDCHENAQKADDLLTKWEAMSDSGQITFAPDGYSYSLVVDAWLSQAADDDVDSNDNNNNHESLKRNELAARNAIGVLQKFVSRGHVRRWSWIEKIQTVVRKCSAEVANELSKELLKC